MGWNTKLVPPVTQVLITGGTVTGGTNVLLHQPLCSPNQPIKAHSWNWKSRINDDNILGSNDLKRPQQVNSLRPSDAIWRQWSWTTLAQVMACCLTAPSHYLNQCWLIVRGVLWHTSESSFAGIAQGIDSGYEFEKDILKNIFKSPRGQWVKIILVTGGTGRIIPCALFAMECCVCSWPSAWDAVANQQQQK